jgi:hypothetical protein
MTRRQALRHLCGDSFFRALPLCAASAPVFSDFTMYAGSSVEAWKFWSANSKSLVFFCTTSPWVRPWDVAQLTRSPLLKFVMVEHYVLVLCRRQWAAFS